MLVLTRRIGEAILIGEHIRLQVLSTGGGKAALKVEYLRDARPTLTWICETRDPVLVDDEIKVRVVRVRRGQIAVGIQAPREIVVLREELVTATQQHKEVASC